MAMVRKNMRVGTGSAIALRRTNRRQVLLGLAAGSLLLASCGQRKSAPRLEPEPAGATSRQHAEPVPPIGAAAPAMPTAAAAPSRIELPAIDVDVPVVALGWHPATDQAGQILSEWDVAEYAAGWHKNSALPGTTGNVVMSGHNNILGAVFRELDQIRRGDEVVVWAGAQRYRYLVDRVVVVPEKDATLEQRQANARWIGPFDDSRLTLVSCWPRNDNTHRIIVVAHLQTEGTESLTQSR
jgi:sortase A